MIDSALKIYNRQKIENMSQKDMIVFLYDSALNSIEIARGYISKKDINETHRHLDQARSIFVHLLGTLNMEIGGEVAQKLSSLYAYFVEKITVANVTKEPKELDDIIPLISELRNSWADLSFDESLLPSKTGNKSMDFQAISVEA